MSQLHTLSGKRIWDTSRMQTFLTRLALGAPRRSRLHRLLFAAGCVAVVTLIRIYCLPMLGNSVPWILFYPAVLISAWYGGKSAGFLATGLSIVIAHYLWIEPPFSFKVQDFSNTLTILLFAAGCMLMTCLCELWHRALQAEAAARAELESLVRARTAELEEKISELEAFSYTLSHDLRAPLRAIQSFSEILGEDYGPQLEPRAKEFLLRVKRAAVRMDRLILDVLNFSRTGDGPLTLCTVDLEHIVRDVLEEYPGVVESGAEVAVEELQPVFGSSALLLQCVSNLIGNAVKFVPPGKRPRIRIWTEQRDGFVRLNVADNGIGIPDRYLSKLGQPFERLHPEAGYEGTGIGLAIVRKAVARMHGRFGVDSKEDQGSTFWIELAGVSVGHPSPGRTMSK